MSHINEKLGLPRAGKRAMMKFPKDLTERNRLTSAKCPSCDRTGARPSKTKGPGWAYCTWCNTVWELQP